MNHPIGSDPSLADRLATFAGKSVFVTGHTGFKGSWLALWLAQLGARVTGYALAPPTEPSNFEISRVRDVLAAHHEADIRNVSQLRAALEQAAPDVVLHLAAQPLVRESYRNPLYTFETNFMGTANLLEAIRSAEMRCSVVVVTSDKCYENFEWSWGYRESDPMGGRDPYSASKGAVELLVSSYRRSFFEPEARSRHGVALASARAGNVIGGGDWSPDHIVVDCIGALAKGDPIRVRNPNAVRPWQHVLESLSGYLTLASLLSNDTSAGLCGPWNFGPKVDDAIPVRDLVAQILAHWGSGSWEDASDPNAPHEAGVLRLAIEKSWTGLGWRPKWSVVTAVAHTVEWYREYLADPQTLQAVCLRQIAEYENAY